MSVIWFTGNSGAGKTTLADAVQRKLYCNVPQILSVKLDGDEMRESISLGAGFSKEDRSEHNRRVARLARVLSEQMTVLVSVIAPFQDVRDELEKICNPKWIYVKRDLPEDHDRPYEPGDYFTVDTDKLTVKESVDLILKEIIHG